MSAEPTARTAAAAITTPKTPAIEYSPDAPARRAARAAPVRLGVAAEHEHQQAGGYERQHRCRVQHIASRHVLEEKSARAGADRVADEPLRREHREPGGA